MSSNCHNCGRLTDNGPHCSAECERATERKLDEAQHNDHHQATCEWCGKPHQMQGSFCSPACEQLDAQHMLDIELGEELAVDVKQMDDQDPLYNVVPANYRGV